MGQVIIRNLDDSVLAHLKAKAKRAGVSLEQSLRDLLAREAKTDREAIKALSRRIRAASKPVEIDATELIREDRDTDHGRH